MDITALVTSQHDYFYTGATRNLSLRRRMLDKLEQAILAHEQDLLDALKEDLGKAPFEAYACEIGVVLSELHYAQKHLERWAKPKPQPSPLALFPAQSRVLRDPYGVVLIVAPWNYPVQLTLVPLISALAAGNCAVVKPSDYASASALAVAKVVEDAFDSSYVAVVQGGRAEYSALLEEPFDYLFFTGSPEVGKSVMTAAAQRLTPVTLELGGKSPVVIGARADLPLAARRIVWGKFLNAGQTCVAPDHIWVPAHLRAPLEGELIGQIKALYGPEPLLSPDLPNIINERHFKRLSALLNCGTLAFGGGIDPVARKIEPTVLTDVTEDDPVMREEIFGPILPLLPYTTLEDLVQKQQRKPSPLALYLFTKDRGEEEYLVERLPSGGVCVNDVVIHLANPHLPFGGVGHSGMGCCHGEAGFHTFSHDRALVRRGKLDLPVRYPPYEGKKLSWLKWLMG